MSKHRADAETIMEYGSTPYVGMAQGEMVAPYNARSTGLDEPHRECVREAMQGFR